MNQVSESIQSKQTDTLPLGWIPWQRYVLVLFSDGVPKNLGRFRRKERVSRKAEDLNRLKGYAAEVIDTRALNER